MTSLTIFFGQTDIVFTLNERWFKALIFQLQDADNIIAKLFTYTDRANKIDRQQHVASRSDIKIWTVVLKSQTSAEK